MIRRTGERAVADGKATLASIKIATDSQSYFAQSLFISILRAEIVKPHRQKPCETQRAPVDRAASPAPFQTPQTCGVFGGSKIYPSRRAPAAVLNVLAVAPVQGHRRLGQFACAGSYDEAVTPGGVPRRRGTDRTCSATTTHTRCHNRHDGRRARSRPEVPRRSRCGEDLLVGMRHPYVRRRTDGAGSAAGQRHRVRLGRWSPRRRQRVRRSVR